ncbi:MAG: 5'-methylthioadenosine/S-adenosylhomocysteine nucleosidase [Oscillospiraceae bacterium]|nr:5'-methylthioadenosine/S-adenosylhomocysteine nucleosidase [Candidatus Limimonas coprohippi]MCQ2488847.1 5'-methylthioadenosine/S-adenosylhomocysteine nucleosidase [Clostridia bacterium]
MKIGIVIAIARELKSFLESDFEIETLNISNKEIYKTKVNNNEVYAIKSGYGLVDAAAATQLLISCYGCEVILNFGVTGALDRALKVDDLFVVTKTINHDYDVSPIDPVKLHQYEEFEDEYIPLDKGMIEFVKSLYPELKEAVDASGDRFIVETQDKINLYNLGCNICDMEIAAIARVCALSGVKCLSIKCISDTFDGDGGDFNTNVTNSANKAFKLMEDILYKL